MQTGRVSVIVPSRNERYLQQTIDSLLVNARGDVEIVVVLDGGPWPDPPLKDDKRLVVIRHNESTGMRPSINEAAQVASGQFLMKCDAHISVEPGYDEALKADCDDRTLLVPTRHSLDPETWTVRPRHFNYTVLTYPFKSSMYGAGFHAVTYPWDVNRTVNKERADILLDPIIGAQGSLWFQRRDYFLSFPPLDHENFGFYQESQECCLRVWMTGGQCLVSKKTAYAHMHKGKDHQGADGRRGRGFYLDLRRKRASESYMVDYCLNDRWPNRVRTFESLIEQFWPFMERMTDERYSWPADWRDWEKHRAAFENRTPDQIPAHIRSVSI